MKHIFENAIANVNAAYPSIYTKQDVVRLIEDLRFALDQATAVEEQKPTVSNDALERIKQSLLEGVRNTSFEDFVELELSYDNRVEITVDDRAIANEIDECFEAAVTEILPEFTEK